MEALSQTSERWCTGDGVWCAVNDGVGIVVIAEHDLWPLDLQFAAFADADVAGWAAEELDDGKADTQKEGNEQVLRGATLPMVMRMRM